LHENLQIEAAKEKLNPLDMMFVEVKPLTSLPQVGKNLVQPSLVMTNSVC
jgi:hypothetical protein